MSSSFGRTPTRHLADTVPRWGCLGGDGVIAPQTSRGTPIVISAEELFGNLSSWAKNQNDINEETVLDGPRPLQNGCRRSAERDRAQHEFGIDPQRFALNRMLGHSCARFKRLQAALAVSSVRKRASDWSGLGRNFHLSV
jgi:hypothetical protein